ncbi:hypothetical protein KIN20_034057 [Parelaphostrongylus tenuis]|uniref:Uncharacterized protein n=1 Tax=Parelaphostrongylus tenuis TaxID=148309 RepID=A0AAD5WIR5_PARTN|nr:hypothetical protein KIN20_034057 [Parelaphostrongylus tenuis]
MDLMLVHKKLSNVTLTQRRDKACYRVVRGIALSLPSEEATVPRIPGTVATLSAHVGSLHEDRSTILSEIRARCCDACSKNNIE